MIGVIFYHLDGFIHCYEYYYNFIDSLLVELSNKLCANMKNNYVGDNFPL